MVSHPLIKEGQRSHKYAFLRASGATLLRLGASLKRVNEAIILENGLVLPCSILLSGKSVSVEEQQIILNVAKYFREEIKSGNKPQFRAGAVIAKTTAATGVSKNSVRKIVSAGKVIDEGKTRKAKVRFGKLDNFDVGVIRRIIHNFVSGEYFSQFEENPAST